MEYIRDSEKRYLRDTRIVDLYTSNLDYTIKKVASELNINTLRTISLALKRFHVVRNPVNRCTEERADRISNTLSKKFETGELTLNTTRERSREYRQKISDTLKNKYSSGEIINAKGMLGKKHSLETRQKKRDSYCKEKHWNWQGGKVSIKSSIRGTFKYRDWRDSVFKRDSYKCTNKKCITPECKYIEADHIIPFSVLLRKYNIESVEEALKCDQLWEIENGRTLCKECHKQTPSYLKRTKEWTVSGF